MNTRIVNSMAAQLRGDKHIARIWRTKRDFLGGEYLILLWENVDSLRCLDAKRKFFQLQGVPKGISPKCTEPFMVLFIVQPAGHPFPQNTRIKTSRFFMFPRLVIPRVWHFSARTRLMRPIQRRDSAHMAEGCPRLIGTPGRVS